MKFHLPLVAIFALTGSLLAEDKALFNGRDLEGWEGNMELWSVKDGVIHGETRPGSETPKKSTLRHNTFLIWKGEALGDFELQAKFRIPSEWGNSGIQYRSKVQSVGPDGPIVAGYQADFESGKTYSGILYEEKGRGILAQRGQQVVLKADAEDPTKIKKSVTGSVGDPHDIQNNIRISEWNNYVVIAKGNHLEHFINGKKTIDVTDDDPRGASEGVIALQIHAGAPMVVEFKEILLSPAK